MVKHLPCMDMVLSLTPSPTKSKEKSKMLVPETAVLLLCKSQLSVLNFYYDKCTDYNFISVFSSAGPHRNIPFQVACDVI